MRNKFKKLDFKMKAVQDTDRDWMRNFIIKQWASEKIISRRKIYYPHKLPGFIAFDKSGYLGLITYFVNFKKKECEIITLDSLKEGKGMGTKLVEKVKRVAKKANYKRIWLITTNDNLKALRFWQKRGFCIKKVYPNALEYSRKIKPEIPLIGNDGIPLRDEIEIEIKFEK